MNETIASPSGRFEVKTTPWEARMSLWVETPTVLDRRTGEILLSFEDSRWSLDEADWVADSVVQLWLRKYPGGHEPSGVMVTVDCLAGTGRVGELTVPIPEVEGLLERTLRWAPAPAPEAPPGFRGVIQRLYRLWRGKA